MEGASLFYRFVPHAPVFFDVKTTIYFFFTGLRRLRSSSSKATLPLLPTGSSSSSSSLILLPRPTTRRRHRRSRRPLPSDSARPSGSAASPWAWTEAAVALEVSKKKKRRESLARRFLFPFLSPHTLNSLFSLFSLPTPFKNRRSPTPKAAVRISVFRAHFPACKKNLVVFFYSRRFCLFFPLVALRGRNLAQRSPKIRGSIHGPPPVPFEPACSPEPIGGGEGAKRRLEKSGLKKQLLRSAGSSTSLGLERNTAPARFVFCESSPFPHFLHSFDRTKHAQFTLTNGKRKKAVIEHKNGRGKSIFRVLGALFAPFTAFLTITALVWLRNFTTALSLKTIHINLQKER